MNPIKIFWFYVTVGLMSIAFSIAYELYLEDILPFKFAKFSMLFEVPEKPEEKLIKELQKFVDADTLIIEETTQEDTARLRQILDSILAEEKKIIFPNDNHEHLWRIFRKAEKGKRIRILHYGDSQIEGERITAQIRNELQKLFGGRGPGLVPVIPVAPKLSVKTEYSDHWKRVPGFGKVDTTIKHGRFGPLIVYFESSPDSSQESWFSLKPNRYAYYRARRYDKAVFFWSIPEDTARIKIFVNDSLYHDSLYEHARLIIKELSIPPGATITFKHSGAPIHVYAISLENKSGKGVIMDNIPLRGSAGTIFTRQNKSFLKLFYDYLKPDLIVLQFGGNVIPYIEDEKRCKNYGRWFASQIRYLKSIAPEASFLVIGPADMATVIDGKLQTYPILECVINVLKEAALQNDAMFWNMYLNMGGSGTIIKWAEADTPLAAKDYVHFTIPGVKKVAQLLWEDILYEYNLYKQAKEEKSEGL
ncbi:MAG: hypothetical protein GXO48_01595 [Chlorobi bacterium]|nr:hypothetical protein [Chlorobiota bacterium]